MIAANPLDGDDASVAEQLRRRLNWRDLGGLHMILRPAIGACDRLRVEASIERIAVLSRAESVHRPALHGGVRAVVRKALDDGVTRTAVGAVDVWIAEARIGWIEQFRQAVFAHRKIGRDAHGWSARGLALTDGEILESRSFSGTNLDGSDARGRRCLLFEIVKKRLERRLGAFQMNVHAMRLIQDPSGE